MELDYSSNGIVRLLETPVRDRSLSWLKTALQQAVMLELATLPPYLCGWWSLDDDSESGQAVSAAIREIIFDEMSHLGHVCNLLTTIGGSPRIGDPGVVAPYPCPLPGGIKPKINEDLKVYLGGLTTDSVEMYSQIEAPEEPLARFAAAAGDAGDAETFPSIGRFYTAIQEAFRQHQGEIKGTRQITRNMEGHGQGNSLFAIRTLADAEAAITIIKEQGEGTDKTPDNTFPGHKGELSHYYVFREIFKGHKLVKVQEDPPKWDFTGAKIPLPKARPMGKVPLGGWATDKTTAPKDPEVKAALTAFNQSFSDMLRSLEKAWQMDTQEAADPHLREAIRVHMRALETPASTLMTKPLPNDPQHTYGPEFLFVPPKA
ncbi:ferritin-like protein [Streptomyces sp. yr375]|uniref:ferritin-like domain-containing protein n=1 Tax=Streptomyces sp. yr375 TaxID=1761906 RepID=UPI000B826DA8|nr:ferritin-like protein [Streptomyces sp. yr375]